MDLYDVIITPKALSQLQDFVSYIQYTLLNEQAAKNVWQDALDTREMLGYSAGSLKLCADPVLRQMGYHMVRFKKHRYLMLFRIEEKTVYVEAIYHELQDYERIFMKELEE